MIHIGHNIARLRSMKRLTQKEVASKLDMQQPEYSKIEQRPEIDDDLLVMIAKALDISPEAIRNFNEEAALNIFSSSLNDNAGSVNHFPIFNFNPIDKLMELVEENRSLYERLLKEKDEVIEIYRQQKQA